MSERFSSGAPWESQVAYCRAIRNGPFITRWEEFARAHKEAFKDFPPATSMLEVQALIHPWMLIEIEADAYVAG